MARHARLSWAARGHRPGDTPPLLILFVNSICNLTCAHCFYWRSLNRRDDLTFAEIEALSAELGPLENLNLSGGEPFLRPELAEICALFARNNGVRQIYVPTSGFFTERTERQVRAVLAQAPGLLCFVCELSLDGTAEYHDSFRGNPRSFASAMETYDRLAALQREDPRLRIHAISTATHDNLDEIGRLTEYLHERCPAMDHHNLAVIRGDRKDPTLRAPALEAYRALYVTPVTDDLTQRPQSCKSSQRTISFLKLVHVLCLLCDLSVRSSVTSDHLSEATTSVRDSWSLY